MTLLEIVEKHPETEHIFRDYDEFAGECLLCNGLFDSIENISIKYGINSDEIISRLNILITED
jgi:hypothetical protein